MQPYFFPYVGYYQLVYEVERFILLDDVNFIKKGFINRNVISNNGREQKFTMPVENISQYRHINEHYYVGKFEYFLKMIEHSYSKAPYYSSIIPIIKYVLYDVANNVAIKNYKSIACIFEYLDVKKEFSFSSDVIKDNLASGQNKIIKLCQTVGIDRYRNAIGGQLIYQKNVFDKNSIELKFVSSNACEYNQGKGIFLPNLSIIDILMYCSKDEVLNLFKNYRLVDGMK